MWTPRSLRPPIRPASESKGRLSLRGVPGPRPETEPSGTDTRSATEGDHYSPLPF